MQPLVVVEDLGAVTCVGWLQWCNGETPPTNGDDSDLDYEPFYTSPTCTTLYKNHISVLLNRVNTGPH